MTDNSAANSATTPDNQDQEPLFYIGLMSGTSADGVDAALIQISNNKIKLIDFCETPIPSALKTQLIDLNQNQNINLNSLCILEHELGQLFATATNHLVQKNNLKAEEIKAVGSHGQTIFHAPSVPMTLQIGHPAFIAKQTGITTVADFRVDDMALGGQGAPFAPAFHEQLFSFESGCFAVNIGGIANISHIAPANQNTPVIGWDTGPGNGIMDQLCQSQFNCQYDKNGDIAQQGKINQALLSQLLAHPYFSQNQPKSTGRETFNLNWVYEVMQHAHLELSKKDLMATLAELTALTIAEQIASLNAPNQPVFIMGGGAYNPFLIKRIQAHLPNNIVAASSDQGINPNAVEAMLIGWLSHQRINNTPVNLASVTGASRNAVLGGVWHP